MKMHSIVPSLGRILQNRYDEQLFIINQTQLLTQVHGEMGAVIAALGTPRRNKSQYLSSGNLSQDVYTLNVPHLHARERAHTHTYASLQFDVV